MTCRRRFEIMDPLLHVPRVLGDVGLDQVNADLLVGEGTATRFNSDGTILCTGQYHAVLHRLAPDAAGSGATL